METDASRRKAQKKISFSVAVTVLITPHKMPMSIFRTVKLLKKINTSEHAGDKGSSKGSETAIKSSGGYEGVQL
eukprot:6461249-Amphidinium_carterae.1